MRKFFLAAPAMLGLALFSATGHAQSITVDPNPISDIFTLKNGDKVVETLTIKESEEGTGGVFKSFATLFPAGTTIIGGPIGIVTAPGEPQTAVSDTVEVSVSGNNRLITVFSDGDIGTPNPNDPSEVKTFRIQNILGNAIPADSITIVSGVPEPKSYILMVVGLGLLGIATRRKA